MTSGNFCACQNTLIVIIDLAHVVNTWSCLIIPVLEESHMMLHGTVEILIQPTMQQSQIMCYTVGSSHTTA